MAHKKGLGFTKNGRDSNAQRRGVKEPDGKAVSGGSIIVRQVGSNFWPGVNVGQGSDFTLFAKIPGKVKFEARGDGRRYVHIIPVE